jgi:hypothetical protein
LPGKGSARLGSSQASKKSKVVQGHLITIRDKNHGNKGEGGSILEDNRIIEKEFGRKMESQDKLL